MDKLRLYATQGGIDLFEFRKTFKCSDVRTEEYYIPLMVSDDAVEFDGELFAITDLSGVEILN